VDERYDAPLPVHCPDCAGPVVQTGVVHQYQEELPVTRVAVRQFDVYVGRCDRCGHRVQGRHPLQTSDAIGAVSATLDSPSDDARFNSLLGTALTEAARRVGAVVHPRGTYVCMEGPQFSTRAESFLYRQWGADVIGMTNLQEAKLAREAEIAYATMALVTDYDCWHPDHDSVTIEMVIEYLNQNSANAQKIIRDAVRRLAAFEQPCQYRSAIKHAILTQRDLIPAETKQKLWAIIGKYFE